jgi:hypothetical protein
VPRSSKVETPAKQVAGFIAKFDPAIAKLTRGARAKMRKRLPTAVELVYDNYNALAIGFGPTERTTDAILSVAAYATGVTLYFTYGKSLPDPHERLEGAGNQGRFVRITSLGVLDEPAVAALVSEAVAHARAPFPEKRGYTIVKSISAKQRPRRPPAPA